MLRRRREQPQHEPCSLSQASTTREPKPITSPSTRRCHRNRALRIFLCFTETGNSFGEHMVTCTRKRRWIRRLNGKSVPLRSSLPLSGKAILLEGKRHRRQGLTAVRLHHPWQALPLLRCAIFVTYTARSSPTGRREIVRSDKPRRWHNADDGNRNGMTSRTQAVIPGSGSTVPCPQGFGKTATIAIAISIGSASNLATPSPKIGISYQRIRFAHAAAHGCYNGGAAASWGAVAHLLSAPGHRNRQGVST